MAPRALLVALLVTGCSLLATSRRLTPSAASSSSIVAFAPGKKKQKKKAASANGEYKVAPKLNLNQKQDPSKPSQQNGAISAKSLLKTHEEMLKDLEANFPWKSTWNSPEDMIKDLGVETFPLPNLKQDLSKPSQTDDTISGKSLKTHEDMAKDLAAFSGNGPMLQDLGVATVPKPQPNLKQDLSKSSHKSDATSGKSLKTTKDMIKELAAAFPKLVKDFEDLKLKQDLSEPSLKSDTISGKSLKTPEEQVKALADFSQMINDLAATFQMTSLELRIWQLRFGRENFDKADQVMQALATPFVGIVTKSGSDLFLVNASTPMTKQQFVEYFQFEWVSEAKVTQSVEQFFGEHEKLTFAQFAQYSLGHADWFSRTFLEVPPL